MAWFLAHLLAGAVGAGLARRYALRHALVDEPGERRSHEVATPRGGGAAIAAALVAGAALLSWWAPDRWPVPVAFAIGLAMVSLVGWIDDHRALSAWPRLAVHVLAGALFAVAIGWHSGAWGVAAVAFVATVALVNVWNFMDGIDGLAASQAVLVAAVAGWLAGGAGLAIGIALAAATLGFLPWNFPRARLFLGDVGSGALGFALGALVAMAAASAGARGLALVLMPLSAFLVDAGFTLARRILRRERWWQPHVTHAFQHAARRHGHVRVTLAFAAWSGLAAAAAWAIRDIAFTSLIISLAAWYALGAAAWWLLQRHGTSPAVENRE